LIIWNILYFLIGCRVISNNETKVKSDAIKISQALKNSFVAINPWQEFSIHDDSEFINKDKLKIYRYKCISLHIYKKRGKTLASPKSLLLERYFERISPAVFLIVICPLNQYLPFARLIKRKEKQKRTTEVKLSYQENWRGNLRPKVECRFLFSRGKYYF